MFANPQDASNLVFPFLLAFITTTLLTPICFIFLKKFGIYDDPSQHKHPGIIHKKPVLRGGGIPFFLGIFIAAVFFVPFTQITIAMFVAGFLALALGTLDDKLDISPYLRFFINILTAAIIVGSGVGIPFTTNPFGGILELGAWHITFSFFGPHTILIISDVLALIWIVWVMNMLNWSKGVDGQMPGIVAISAAVIGFLSLRFPLIETNTLISSTIAFAITGSALGFLIYNFYPAKIFPGYGATAVYLLLATISILSGAKLATAILVMGVPMMDGIFTVVRRVATGHSPMWHDRKHLHHILLRLGFSQRYIALFYWIVSAILGAISLYLDSQGKLFALIMLAVVVMGALLFLHLAVDEHEKEQIS